MEKRTSKTRKEKYRREEGSIFHRGVCRADGKSDTWNCTSCTLTNPNSVTTCSACGTKKGSIDDRPISSQTTTTTTTTTTSSSGGSSSTASELPSSDWVCEACTYHNPASAERCSICSEPSPTTISRARRAPPESPTRPPLPQSGPEQLIGLDPSSIFPFSSVFSPATAPTVATPASSSGSVRSSPTNSNSGAWECHACTFKNPTATASCGTCQTPNPNFRPTTTSVPNPAGTPPPSTGGFRSLLQEPQWACTHCGALNIQGLILCLRCRAPNAQLLSAQPQQQCIIS